MKYSIIKENKYENNKVEINKNKWMNIKKMVLLTIFGCVTLGPATFIAAREIDYYNFMNSSKRIYKEEINSLDIILDNVSDLVEKLEINNPIELCGFIYKLVNLGDLSYDGIYSYDETQNKDNLYDIPGYPEFDVIMGLGVCRNESKLVTEILKKCGYEAYSINNILSYKTESKNKVSHEFTLIIYENNAFIYDFTNDCFFTFDNNILSLTEPTSDKYKEFIDVDIKIGNSYAGGRINLKEVFKIYKNLISNKNEFIEEKLMEEYNKGKKIYNTDNMHLINQFILEITDEKNMIATNLKK